MQKEKGMRKHKFLPAQQVYDMMPIDDISCKYLDTRGCVVNMIIQMLMLVIGPYMLTPIFKTTLISKSFKT